MNWFPRVCVLDCQFATIFADEPIVVTLSRQLSWSHFVSLLLQLKDPPQREYYAQMCCAERWSVSTQRGRIDTMLYERTALSRQPDALIAHELATMQDAQRRSPARSASSSLLIERLEQATRRAELQIAQADDAR